MKPEVDYFKDPRNKAILEIFKERVKDCHLIDSTDQDLIKWLIVKEFDVDQAEKLLRQTLEWRRVNRVDEILETFTPPEVFTKYLSIHHVGKDKIGCPLWISSFGRNDFKGIAASMTKKDIQRLFQHQAERMVLAIRADKPRNTSRQLLVFDMEELSLKQITNKAGMDVLLSFLNIIESYYPDFMRYLFIVNAPPIFSILYKMAKPLFTKCTFEKLVIYTSSNKEEWKAALLELVDADQLPKSYGGTMSDEKLHRGGEIPHSYYLSNNQPVARENFESLSVSAGSKKLVKFQVGVVNSILRWEFMTDAGDIAFRVFTKDAELLPTNKVESHLVMEEGEICCESKGEYLFEFDNTFSMLKSKKVRYLIVVLPPTSA